MEIKPRGAAVQEQTVAIGIQDLVKLMASEVARQVADELRENDITPLYDKIRNIELQLARPDKELEKANRSIVHWRGVFDGLWKGGVVVLALLQAYYMVHGK